MKNCLMRFINIYKRDELGSYNEGTTDLPPSVKQEYTPSCVGEC